MIETLPRNISLDVYLLFFSQAGVYNKLFFLYDKTPAWTAIKEQLKRVDQVFSPCVSFVSHMIKSHCSVFIYRQKLPLLQKSLLNRPLLKTFLDVPIPFKKNLD